MSAFGGRVAGVAGRVGWGISDQALSSLTNFAVGIWVARSLGVTDFGAFTLAFTTYLVALNVSRALATDPLVVRYSGAEPARWRTAIAAATGTAAVVGILSGACCVVIGLLLRGPLREAFVAVGLVLPGLLIQDGWRYAFFSAARGGQAFLNDLVWTVAQCVTFGLLAITQHDSILLLVLAWGGAAAVAAAAGAVQARAAPRPSAVVGWLREQRDLVPRYLGENLTVSGERQLRNYGLGVIAGLTAVGSLRAAELLLGPFNIVFMGVGMMAVPEAVRALHRSARRFVVTSVVLGATLGVAALVWGVAMLLLPRSLGVDLLGSSWPLARRLLLGATISTASVGASAGALVGLRALGAARRSFRARIVGSACMLAGALLGAGAGGVLGAVWGLAGGSLLATAVWWWEFGRGARELEQRAATVSSPLGGHRASS